MASIYNSILEIIGNTPLLEPVRLEKELQLKGKLLLKLEYLNPTGSVKDRAAKGMIEDAEKKVYSKKALLLLSLQVAIQALG